MNAFVSIALVCLFFLKGLVPGMDFFCELQKLPNLFEHYEQHKECHDDSFWEFLFNHYLQDQENKTTHHDEAEHDKLPFHGSHHCAHVAVFYATIQCFSLKAIDFRVQPTFGYYHSLFHSQFLDSLFQPPRL